MLRLHEEDEEDESAREDEPFVIGRLGESKLLREVFFDAMSPDAPAQPRVTSSGSMPCTSSREYNVVKCPSGFSARPSDGGTLPASTPGASQPVSETSSIDANSVFIASDAPAKTNASTRSRARSFSMSHSAPGRETVRVELFGRTDLVAQSCPHRSLRSFAIRSTTRIF